MEKLHIDISMEKLNNNKILSFSYKLLQTIIYNINNDYKF